MHSPAVGFRWILNTNSRSSSTLCLQRIAAGHKCAPHRLLTRPVLQISQGLQEPCLCNDHLKGTLRGADAEVRVQVPWRRAVSC